MSRGDRYVSINKDSDEIIIDSKAIRMAYPDVWEQIYQEGKRAGYGERTVEERKETAKIASISPTEDRETKKKRLINEYREGHPGVSLKEAILAIGKSNPGLFR